MSLRVPPQQKGRKPAGPGSRPAARAPAPSGEGAPAGPGTGPGAARDRAAKAPVEARAPERPADAPVGRPPAWAARRSSGEGAAVAGGTVLGARLGLAAPAPPFGSAAFERRLDEVTGSRAREENRVRPLFDGAEAFAERFRLLDEATSSIHLQTYRFTDDETGWLLAKKLVEKAEAGVEVRVIYDAIGSLPTNPAVFAFLKAGGVEVRARDMNPLFLHRINDRWHEKHFIVDGRASIEGGMNIADEYAFGGTDRLPQHGAHKDVPPFRDVDVLVEGPAVHDAQRAFLKNWASLGPAAVDDEPSKYFPPVDELRVSGPPPGPAVRVVQHRPGDDGDDFTNQLYLQCIRSATKSITIENAYFLPPPEVQVALIEAAKRGVDVRIMTNSVQSNNHGFVSEAARYFYEPMIKAGVKIYERTGPPTLHSKTATFDGEYSIIGSCNLNNRSKGRDSECVVCTGDDVTAARLADRFDAGLPDCALVTLEDLANDGFLRNLKQWALSSLAWTF